MPRFAEEAAHGTDMGARILRIDSREALARFRSSLVLPRSRISDLRIVLQESYFGPDAKEVERRVNELYADCGCEAGGLSVLVALVGLFAWWGFSGTTLDWSLGLRALAVLAIAAVIGKVFGILYGRVTLFRLLSRLERLPSSKLREEI